MSYSMSSDNGMTDDDSLDSMEEVLSEGIALVCSRGLMLDVLIEEFGMDDMVLAVGT